jgi:hypothetical protein
VSYVASKIVTYDALGTTWKVARELADSEGLKFIQDYLSGYDLSKLEHVEIKLSRGWGYHQGSRWTNTAAGHCAGPWATGTRKFQLLCKVNGRTEYPADDWVTAKTKEGKRKVPYTVYSRDEAIIGIVAHEVCHYLGYTDQIPKHGKMHTWRRKSWNSTTEIECGEFEMAAVEAFRNRYVTPPDTESYMALEGALREAIAGEVSEADVTPSTTESCQQCGRQLSSVSRSKKFCSDECRNLYHSARRSERTAETRQKICQGCGVQFTAGKSNAKTCSARCRKRIQRGAGLVVVNVPSASAPLSLGT